MDEILTEDQKWEMLKTWGQENEVSPEELLDGIKLKNLATTKKIFKDPNQMEFTF